MTRPRMFSGRQVATIAVSICLTVVLMPATVWAAASASLTRITDGTGKVAQVDSKGRLAVSDGNGSITVDGKVAVTGKVNGSISDPIVPSRKARVDGSGRLTTAGVTSTIVQSGFLYHVNSESNFITQPTTATLDITRLSFSNPSFNKYATWAEVQVSLYQTEVNANGGCTSTQQKLLGIYNIAPGEDVSDALPAPLVVAPRDSKPYCLDLYTETVTGQGARFGGGYLPSYNLAAYVSSGKYYGSNARPAAIRPAPRNTKAATHR